VSAADNIRRDLDELDPTFRERVVELVRRLESDEHEPYVFEARRSEARAEELQRRGTGVAKSMHCYGLAVDIIDRFHRWNAKPAFWSALRRHAEELGLTSGASFHRVDRPHVQALPASHDEWVRHASPEEIAAKVKLHLDHSSPSERPTVRDSVRAKAR
jgi:hypothetical protein